ncbi:hypothetical protein B0T18DRAFT_387907 [Schizothecium vesticola]|uniref:Uncharacterized protein n=1 Tax=Schizothecium vesticola TaxID=314040 RepID=A0AA40KA80_9PEZI|nr:hypothetical protein B0T18DRAFT_387907 [Schizothecium vesticola]
MDRFTAVPGCYRLVVKHGFMDEVISPYLAALLYEQVRKFVVRQAREKYGVREKEAEGEAAEAESVAPGGGKQRVVVPVELRDEEVAAELAHLDRAYAARIMYIVGRGADARGADVVVWAQGRAVGLLVNSFGTIRAQRLRI